MEIFFCTRCVFQEGALIEGSRKTVVLIELKALPTATFSRQRSGMN